MSPWEWILLVVAAWILAGVLVAAAVLVWLIKHRRD